MTIKKRLFLSNLFMLLIPALVSVLILALSMLLFVNLFYKQAMDETVHGTSPGKAGRGVSANRS